MTSYRDSRKNSDCWRLEEGKGWINGSQGIFMAVKILCIIRLQWMGFPCGIVVKMRASAGDAGRGLIFLIRHRSIYRTIGLYGFNWVLFCVFPCPWIWTWLGIAWLHVDVYSSSEIGNNGETVLDEGMAEWEFDCCCSLFLVLFDREVFIRMCKVYSFVIEIGYIHITHIRKINYCRVVAKFNGIPKRHLPWRICPRRHILYICPESSGIKFLC